MRLTIALGLASGLILSACTTLEGTERNGDTQDEIVALTTFAAADLRVALADAQAHDDVIAATCWAKLIDVVEGIPALTEARPIGAASAYQKARNIRRRLDSGWSDDVRMACAALADDGRDTIGRLVRLIAGRAIPGL